MTIERLASALADRYRIERELGAGGMATVYLAHDVRHDRKVALKVLKPELSAILGAKRFLQEIKTTANLQHPHILALFDSGVAQVESQEPRGVASERTPLNSQLLTIVYYAMPYVEGESLRDRLTRDKQLPVEDAVRIAREVADALEYAHQRGVVHRDIKPENILLHGGHAMVADFGIALAASRSDGSSRITETGMSLGTPHYMAPEQAMGARDITARADVYALGVTLYEMLTGDPPFTGSTPQAIVAQVLTEAPRSITDQRHTVTPRLEAAIFRALEKLPADRFASAQAFATALQGEAAAPRHETPTLPLAAVRGRRRRSAIRLGAAGAVLLGAGFVAGGILWHPGLPPVAGFGRATKITWDRGLEIEPALSPDARYVAYAAGNSLKTKLLVRQVTGGRPLPLTAPTDSSQSEPTWSPDGARILFVSGGQVFSAPATGGVPRPEVPTTPLGRVSSAHWAPDGRRIVYVVGDSVMLFAPGEAPHFLAQLAGPSTCRWSPRASLIACTVGNAASITAGPNFGNLSPSRIAVIGVADGAVHYVSDSLTLNQSPTWGPDDRWLYYVSAADGPRDIYARALTSDGAPRGRAMRLTTGLGAQAITISPDGTRLAYSAFSQSINVYGLPGPVPLTSGEQNVDLFRFSRDGRWMLFTSDVSGVSELYRVPTTGGEIEQLTVNSSADNFGPDLSPDGREVAFHSWRSGSRDIYVLPLDGGAIQQVTTTPDQEMVPIWSPDGRALVYSMFTRQGGVWISRRDSTGRWGTPEQLAPFGTTPKWSPDGRTIVFAGSAYIDRRLFTIPSAGGTPREPIPVADRVRWVEAPGFSEDGRTIYFKSHDAEGNAEIWSLPASGGTPRRVVQLSDDLHPSYNAFWGERQGHFAFTSEDRRSDIVVMEVVPR